MRIYEVLIALDPGASAADADALLDKLKALVVEVKGEVKGVEKLGLRKLAYKVRGKAEGQFFVLTCEAPTVIVAQMEKVLRLHEGVLRSMTTRIDPAFLVTAAGPGTQPKPAP